MVTYSLNINISEWASIAILIALIITVCLSAIHRILEIVKLYLINKGQKSLPRHKFKKEDLK